MAGIQVHILTPDGARFEGEASGVVMPGVLGSFEVRQKHANLVSTLEVGQVKVKTADREVFFAISGGTVEVSNNHVSLVVESAETVDEIDRERAEKAKERALARLTDKDMDRSRAKRALERAENRLKLLLTHA